MGAASTMRVRALEKLAAAYKAHKEGTAGNIVAVGKKRKAGE